MSIEHRLLLKIEREMGDNCMDYTEVILLRSDAVQRAASTPTSEPIKFRRLCWLLSLPIIGRSSP